MIEESGGYKTGPECPKLPSLRQLTAQLRDLHEAWSHPDTGRCSGGGIQVIRSVGLSARLVAICAGGWVSGAV